MNHFNDPTWQQLRAIATRGLGQPKPKNTSHAIIMALALLALTSLLAYCSAATELELIEAQAVGCIGGDQ